MTARPYIRVYVCICISSLSSSSSRLNSALHETCLKSHIGLVVLFNGALEPNRMSEWTWRQIRDRDRIQKTFRHVITKGSHPSKDWWVPPVGLKQTLMLSLRYLGVSVSLTMDDHHQEVIAYCRFVPAQCTIRLKTGRK